MNGAATMINGCTEYDAMSVTIYFPAGHVCCDLCPLLETYARKQCRRTGEYILDSRTWGLRCPLVEEEKQEEQYEPYR